MKTEFNYSAYDKAGIFQKGSISATDLQNARTKITELGLILVKIESSEETSTTANSLFKFRRRPALSDVEFITSQLAMLLKSGVKIDHALLTIAPGIKNLELKKDIYQIHEDIRSGASLSEAFEKYPDVFDSLYTSIVSIGETTGNLASVFDSLALDLSFRQGVISKTRQALIYPSIILAVCVIAIFFIFNFIVPRFSGIFAATQNLPIYTQILLTGSDLFRQYQFYFLPIIAAIVAMFVQVKRKKKFRYWWDAQLIKLPMLKSMSYALENLRFVSALSILLQNGVVITTALDYAIKSVGNSHIRARLLTVTDNVRQGKKLSEAIVKIDFFPKTYISLIEVGEQTGNLSGIFSQMKERLNRIYENRIIAFITLIEPLMILVMGTIVGSVVVVMMLSIVSINDVGF